MKDLVILLLFRKKYHVYYSYSFMDGYNSLENEDYTHGTVNHFMFYF